MDRLPGLDCAWDFDQGLIEGPQGVHRLSERERALLARRAPAVVPRHGLARLLHPPGARRSGRPGSSPSSTRI
jgi:hypothetical protein